MACAPVLGEVDEQPLEELDAHVRQVAEHLVQHLLALLEREERLRLLRVADHGHDHVVEVPTGPLDDVEVTVGHGVERSRTEGGGQGGAAPRGVGAPAARGGVAQTDTMRRSVSP